MPAAGGGKERALNRPGLGSGAVGSPGAVATSSSPRAFAAFHPKVALRHALCRQVLFTVQARLVLSSFVQTRFVLARFAQTIILQRAPHLRVAVLRKVAAGVHLQRGGEVAQHAVVVGDLPWGVGTLSLWAGLWHFSLPIIRQTVRHSARSAAASSASRTAFSQNGHAHVKRLIG